jgi:hypothetical protein
MGGEAKKGDEWSDQEHRGAFGEMPWIYST